MTTKTPEHAVELLDKTFNEGDLERVLRCYDDAAVVIPIPGTQTRGTKGTAHPLSALYASGITAKQIKTNVLEADGIALFTSRWTLNIDGEPPQTFIATTVFRQQLDGGWKALIDNARGPQILERGNNRDDDRD